MYSPDGTTEVRIAALGWIERQIVRKWRTYNRDDQDGDVGSEGDGASG